GKRGGRRNATVIAHARIARFRFMRLLPAARPMTQREYKMTCTKAVLFGTFSVSSRIQTLVNGKPV
ncbi:hypothetical protein, partial [Falsihalocynthiibacter arcticus]|uniref:hypothetical protein n=1 Tax=Falsihalocynthiibacter arcticus TaxID=1579316 RepID=UPI0030014D9E